MRALAASLLLLCLSPCARPQDSLPLVQAGDWTKFRSHSQDLLRTIRATDPTVLGETDRKVEALLRNPGDDPQEAMAKIQNLLDSFCLIGIHINPESRVKAARGPARAELTHNAARLVLLKIHNEAGITTALRVYGRELLSAKEQEKDRWLEAAFLTTPPLSKTLTGLPLEYRVLRLTPREVGKREATLKFDAGQGTQDLGFRAEVPILFRISSARPVPRKEPG